MIFPDITVKKWLQKYPDLKVLTTNCLQCSSIIETLTPFRTKDYIGLCAKKCPGCGVEHKMQTAFPYSKTEIAEWENM